MRTNRPLAITAVCTLLVIAGASDIMSLVGAVRVLAKGDSLPLWLGVFNAAFAPVIKVGCAVGMWSMRRWSVYLLACWVPLQTFLLYVWLGVFSLPALIVESVVIVVAFYFICARRNGQAEPLAPPNCGPALPLDNSGATEGPPSVS
jgi:hypothetical protein